MEVNDLTEKEFEVLIPKSANKVKFIDDEIYADLYKEWVNIWPGKKAKVYQEKNRVKDRCEFLIKHGLPYLAGKRVLEIGCNAGLQGYHIDQVASSYIGVEPGNKISNSAHPKTDYFLQAKKTEAYMSEEGHFYNWTIEELVEHRGELDFDSFFASFALYHFEDFELKLLEEYIFPKCNTIVIQTRLQNRPTKHNKYKFWKSRNVEGYFFKQGFECVTINEKSKKYSLQICTRVSV